MKDGRVVERGAVRELYRDPREEYTMRLLEAAGIREKTVKQKK